MTNEVEVLDEYEIEIIRQCLVAVVEGEFWPDYLFHTLFGLENEDVRQTLKRWPHIDYEVNRNDLTAVNNSLNHLTGYPHRKDVELMEYVEVGRDEIIRILGKWRRSVGLPSSR